MGQIAGLSRYIWGSLEALGNIWGRVYRGTRQGLVLEALDWPVRAHCLPNFRLQLRFMTTLAGAVRNEAFLLIASRPSVPNALLFSLLSVFHQRLLTSQDINFGGKS